MTSALYRLLLWLYPASFRHAYAREMTADFATRRRAATSGGAVFQLWTEAIVDAVRNGPAAHWELLRQDLRTTRRSPMRAPAFTVAAILVAGVGIGATTAAFSIADYVLIQPLPFPHPDRLVALWEDQSYRGYSQLELSPANYRDWAAMNRTLESAGASRGLSVNLVGLGVPEHVEGAALTADVFTTLGVHPRLGRVFTASDDQDGAPGTVLLSSRLWQTHFGGADDVIGRTIRLDDRTYTIVGVMPADFNFPARTDLFWTPMQFAPADFADRANYFLHGIGRLKPGVTLTEARADFDRVASVLASDYPKENAQTRAAVVDLRGDLSFNTESVFVSLAGASVCVLLIACSNLASLLLARALGRRRELAVRAALGAGRERLVRQMLTESAVLAVVGGALGVGLALLATPTLARLVPDSLPIAQMPGIDGRLLALATLVTIAAAIGFGVGPALRAGRTGTAPLREDARAGASRRTERIRSTLVAIQIATSVALLVVSTLLVRALWRVERMSPGFATDHVLSARTVLPMPSYQATAKRTAYYQRVLDELRQEPGVTSAAFTSFLPMTMRGGFFPVTVDGHAQDPSRGHVAIVRYVTPDFFHTMGIPLIAGRDFTDADGASAPWVAVVSESFATQNWPGESPLGRRFDVAFHQRTVIGMVGNVAVRGVEHLSEPQTYLSAPQTPDNSMVWFAPKDLVVRTSGDPEALVPILRHAVEDADPDLPIADVQTLETLVGSDQAPRMLQVRVLGGFAAMACLLAALGIHGLLAFTVSARTREIGLRMALGARAANILAVVLKRSALMGAIGIAAGAGVAFIAGQGLRSVLAGVSPTDSVAFGVAATLAIVITLASSVVPAFRAVRVDPLTAIRRE